MSFIVRNQIKILVGIATLLLLGGIFWVGTKVGEPKGKKVGEDQGKESVCQELEDKIAEMNDPKLNINLDICQEKVKKDELPKTINKSK